MPAQLYYALSLLADLLLLKGNSILALALLRAQVTMAPQDESSQRALSSLERARWIPLLIRDDTYPQLVPPEGELSKKQRESYITAMAEMLHLRYEKTIAALESLANQFRMPPSFGEHSAMCEALRSIPKVRSTPCGSSHRSAHRKTTRSRPRGSYNYWRAKIRSIIY